MALSSEHHAYVVETYLKNAESVIAMQRLVQTYLRLGQNATVPGKKTHTVMGCKFQSYRFGFKEKTAW
jgi:hypothetical protein